jgi:hypothetical protein
MCIVSNGTGFLGILCRNPSTFPGFGEVCYAFETIGNIFLK